MSILSSPVPLDSGASHRFVQPAVHLPVKVLDKVAEDHLAIGLGRCVHVDHGGLRVFGLGFDSLKRHVVIPCHSDRRSPVANETIYFDYRDITRMKYRRHAGPILGAPHPRRFDMLHIQGRLHILNVQQCADGASSIIHLDPTRKPIVGVWLDRDRGRPRRIGPFLRLNRHALSSGSAWRLDAPPAVLFPVPDARRRATDSFVGRLLKKTISAEDSSPVPNPEHCEAGVQRARLW